MTPRRTALAAAIKVVPTSLDGYLGRQIIEIAWLFDDARFIADIEQAVAADTPWGAAMRAELEKAQ